MAGRSMVDTNLHPTSNLKRPGDHKSMWAAVSKGTFEDVKRFDGTDEAQFALYYAIIAGRVDLIDKLTLEHATVMAFSGITHALDVAIQCGNIAIAQYLYDIGYYTYSDNIVRKAVRSGKKEAIAFTRNVIRVSRELFNVEMLIASIRNRDLTLHILDTYGPMISRNKITNEQREHLSLVTIGYADIDIISRISSIIDLVPTKDMMDLIAIRNDLVVTMWVMNIMQVHKGLISRAYARAKTSSSNVIVNYLAAIM
jgi:hypothetical protein